ncbi:ABC transporter substrate-binding protein [Ethanoligenens harbinense]|uniref:Periplasmic binding protein n=1 Tax=Ethanoligenens harbinense (strain DSM 18485 / JCM 12961 / CGMCC 1.5033 / YUAN-3) TaxID=663278 RepID=E6U458_ETHHY|nr:ABC transporter substrate-binding protein [Ethanoligenens harbinense]ADU26558.1 periplasmic binding protein [Ethanoligenens harbinense YUAN-3]
MQFKKALAVVVALAIATVMAGCSKNSTSATSSSSASSSVSVTSGTRTFTDSAGRVVEIPANITRVAPSGSLAQLFLYSLCPDKLVGLSGKFADSAKPYIDSKYYNLPVFGQFYGKNVNLNIEALAAAKPQIIIDIGEKKATEKEDMDGVQKQTGIPVIFVEATLDSMAKAYVTLGNILGEQAQAKKLSDYISSTLSDAKTKSATISASKKVKVYYGLGSNGLQTNPKGSIHADEIKKIGAVNVADVTDSTGAGGVNVSMEQVVQWAPDVMIFDPQSVYSTVATDPLWNGFAAVKNKKVYEVPIGPYNWMGRPPSVNQILGIKWLGNLIYPNVYKYNMVQEAEKYYQLFYNYKLTDDQAKKLMANSTYKQ